MSNCRTALRPRTRSGVARAALRGEVPASGFRAISGAAVSLSRSPGPLTAGFGHSLHVPRRWLALVSAAWADGGALAPA
jgi:hypothetical protein